MREIQFRSVYLLAVAALCGTLAFAADVQSIQLNAGAQLLDGEFLFDPFYIDATVVVSDASAIQLTTPNGCSASFVRVGERTWWLSDSGYEDLAEMRSDPCLGFGDFLFEISGLQGQSDSVTLAFDPGTAPPFVGWPEIAHPLHDATSVSLEPLYQWSCAGSCGPDGWDLQIVEDASGLWRYDQVRTPSVTQWDPGPLDPYTDYGFWAHSVQLLSGNGPTTTDQGDAFGYYPTFESFNAVWFTTLERIVLQVEPGQLHWTSLGGAFAYDVVRGDLALLSGSSGNFTTATSACEAENTAGSPLAHTAAPTTAGEGWWYLVRGVDALGGLGYDSLVSFQSGTRDSEIDASVVACL